MRLVSFGLRGAEQPGVLTDGDEVVPLAPLLDRLGIAGVDMCGVLGLLSFLRAEIEREVEAGAAAQSLSEIRLGPPVPRPRQVLMLGANYRSHIASSSVSQGRPPTKPMLVGKPTNTLAGPFDEVVKPLETNALDYEVELVVVVGKSGRRIPRARAHEHIAGFMVANDVTAHDELLGDFKEIPFYLQLTRGKGFDTFLPTGPWITTIDAAGDPTDKQVELYVNDELRQSERTSDMLSDVFATIEETSGVMTLYPGDLILTGSPPGGGGHQEPPRYLAAGDVVRARIEGLGELRNTIVDEAG
jgi:2-keto-4-pentenoate hydratase/2-oxohepta-3-ene-1,7-dioic acid hydratase in catechol pathway